MHRSLVCVGVVALLLLRSAPVHAQTEEYDRLVLEALQAFDAGDWATARRLFERAHGIDPTARTLRTIGMAAFNQGDFVAALQNLEAALTDERKPLTDDQRAHVRQLIGQADARVGRYRLVLEPEGARLSVDGKSPALVGEAELLLLPGRHELELSAEGYASLRRELAVEPGDRAALELKLTPGDETQQAGAAEGATTPEAASEAVAPTEAVAAPTTSEVGEAASASAGGSSTRTWGWVTLAVGSAALIGSGISAGLALDAKSELDDGCPDRRCPPELHGKDDDYDTLRVVSGVTLGVGVLGAVIGTVLVLSGGDDEPPTAARLTPMLGPGFAGVRGAL